MRPSTPFLAFALLAVFLPAYSAPVELNMNDPLKVEKFFGPNHAVKIIRAPHSDLKFIGRPSTLQFRAPQIRKGKAGSGRPSAGDQLTAGASVSKGNRDPPGGAADDGGDAGGDGGGDDGGDD